MTALATRHTALATITDKLATRFDLGNNGQELIETLKATAFKGQVTDAQMTALMIVANQFGLNPWCKEIYAFPDRQNGIVPVVGVDGWSRIINDHPQFDGMEFVQEDDFCTCSIYRKDRGHPTRVTEYRSECHRDTAPWKSHPRRMLRHKAMIQCARLAFGYGGIYDQDEAERIIERPMGPAEVIPSQPTTSRTEAVKARLAARAAPVQTEDTGPDLATTLKIIEEAYTVEEMEQAAAIAKQLQSASDKAAARQAFASRKAALKEMAEAEAKAEREAIQAEGEMTTAEWQASLGEVNA